MEKGDVVISTSGSDTGKVYVVTGESEKGYLLLADGKRHALARPKRKNPRHVKNTGIRINVPKFDYQLIKLIKELKIL
ncbi:MAG: hypothetical protein J6Y68_03700 [Clostridia bacterium]|nr:hypothetical protein [Clostridia bacterium]MBP5593012.1 hypothetical protein [Clostridia bacterium]MBP5649133.1 hypothetical protein [Clostridia bacterium]